MSRAVQALVSVAIVLAAFQVDACTCPKPKIEGTYYDSQHYVAAKIIGKVTIGSEYRYTLQVLKNYKGCSSPKIATVYSKTSPAACGMNLMKHSAYVLPIRKGPKPEIFSCDYIVPLSALTEADKKFLNTRNICCKGVCKCASGDPPVNCFVPPCDVATPPCPEAKKCVDNYCGGCFDEWFTEDGRPACLH